MIEDVLVKVDKFIFLSNFIVLDMEEDKEILIMLGRPFLATGRAMIDVQKGELKLRVEGEEITFHVFQPTKHPDDDPNKDSSDLHPKEIMQGDLVNFRDKSLATQRGTKRIKVMAAKTVHPP